MSTEAMYAFHRLEVRLRFPSERRPRRLDSTAMLVLSYLCWKHMAEDDLSRPGSQKMAAALDRNRSVVNAALRRLERCGLIRRECVGGGSGNATGYRLMFLRLHRLNPPDPKKKKQPIVWERELSGPLDSMELSGGPDSLETETVRGNDANCPGGRSQTVRAPGPSKDKNIKTPPARAAGRAGGPKKWRPPIGNGTSHRPDDGRAGSSPRYQTASEAFEAALAKNSGSAADDDPAGAA